MEACVKVMEKATGAVVMEACVEAVGKAAMEA